MAIFSSVTTPFLHAYIPKSAVSPITRRRVIRCSSASILTNFNLCTCLTALIKEIDQKLDEAVPVGYPEQIYESMRYSLLAKGSKRAPALMCIAACKLFGGDRAAPSPPPARLKWFILLH